MLKGLGSLFVVAPALFFVVAIPTNAAVPFFENKTIQIIVGFSAGGGFDTYARVIARHLGKHIPGTPTVIVQNMPGAGSLVAANYMYMVAKPDGLTIGNFHGNQILSQVIERPGIQFDARKFGWVGVPAQENGACAFLTASGITSLEKWKQARLPVKLGVGGPGDATYNSAKEV